MGTPLQMLGMASSNTSLPAPPYPQSPTHTSPPSPACPPLPGSACSLLPSPACSPSPNPACPPPWSSLWPLCSPPSNCPHTPQPSPTGTLLPSPMCPVYPSLSSDGLEGSPISNLTPSPSTSPPFNATACAKKKRKSNSGGRRKKTKRSRRDLSQGNVSALLLGTLAWLMSALGMLRSEPLGDKWSVLVGLWEAFEVGEGFMALLNLSPRGRLPCVSDWIKCVCSPSYHPALTNSITSDMGL